MRQIHRPPRAAEAPPKTRADPGRGWDPERVGMQLSGWRMALISLSLCVLVVSAFWPVFHAEFVNYDDPFYVTDNPQVANGLSWAGFRWAWQDAHLGTWHPLTWLSHMVDVACFGLNAPAHHLVNLGLHVANTLLVFFLFYRATGTVWRCVLIATWFGVHPLRVESVAWISERKDVLSAFFFLLTLHTYFRFARLPPESNRRAQHLWLALVFFALGLLSKPMLVTVPLLLLLLDFWPLNRIDRSASGSSWLRLIKEKGFFFALALADGGVTIWSQAQAGAMKTATEVPLVSRLANAVVAVVGYLWHTLWPADLAVFYPFQSAWPAWKVLGAGLVLLGISAACLGSIRSRPWLSVGWGWYCLTILPVAGLIQVGGHSSADRYTYIPLLGVFLVLAWLGAELVQRFGGRRWAALAMSGFIVLAWGQTRRQSGYWENSEVLFRHALEVTQNNVVAHQCLGAALLERGQLDAAAAEFRKVLRLHPEHQDARLGLGTILGQQGELDAAETCFRQVLSENPRSAHAHYRLANLLGRKGHLPAAVAEYQAALELEPNLAAARNDLANALQRQGRVEEAIAQYRLALRIAPSLAEARNNLGRALMVQGRAAEAIAEWHAALRSKPAYAEAHNNLGNALLQQGQPAQALPHYQAALAHNPRYASAENGLAGALVALGRTNEAKAHFAKAISLDPNSAETHYNLALLLARLGKSSDAQGHFRAALALQPALAGAHRELGRLLASAERPREAAAELQLALRLAPDDPAALCALAELLLAQTEPSLRQPDTAVELAERADELTNGAELFVLETLARAYAAAGDTTNAVETVQRALPAAQALRDTNRVYSLQQLQERLLTR